MLHEMTHITIMLSALWDEFKYENGTTIPESEVYDDSVDPPILKSPKLLETVRDHYDCGTADGMAVQSSSAKQIRMSLPWDLPPPFHTSTHAATRGHRRPSPRRGR